MRWSPVVELRQYTLLPGKRDELIRLFEAQFIESQERTGAKISGTFRDMDDPTKFVWLRGFPSLADRPRSLGEFYGGPDWKRHRDAANATMVDSDDVLLLRPACDDQAFALPPERPPVDSVEGRDLGVVEATVVSLHRPAGEDLLERLPEGLSALVGEEGGTLLGAFVTCEEANNFPVLPVREGEHVVVWFEGYASRAGYYASGTAQPAEMLGLDPASFRSQVLRLQPTRRSLLTGIAVPAKTPQAARRGH